MLIVGGNRINNKSVWAYDDENNLLWSYDTGGNVRYILLHTDGYIYVCGVAADNGDGNGTRNLWKLDQNGVYWGGRYVRSTIYAWSCDIDSTGKILVGTGNGVAVVTADFSSETVIPYVTSGTYEAVAVDSQDNYYFGGGGTPENLVKYNSSLVYQWAKDPHTAASTNSIRIMSDDSVLLSVQQDTHLHHYASDGTDLGTTSTIDSQVWKISLDENDNIYVAASGGSGKVVKMDSSGNILWTIPCLNISDFYGISLTLDSQGRIHVVASNEDNGGVYRIDPNYSTRAVGYLDLGTDLYGIALTDGSNPGQPIVDEFDKNEGYTDQFNLAGNNWWAQIITPTTSLLLSRLLFRIGRDLAGTSGNVTIKIQGVDVNGKPDGNDLATVILDITKGPVGSTGVLELFLSSAIPLIAGGSYSYVVTRSAGGGRLGGDSAKGYTGGKVYTSSDGGITWSGTTPEYDLFFGSWGEEYFAPGIVDQSEDSIFALGSHSTLFVTASGTEPLLYQWYKNGVVLIGETSATLEFFAAYSDAGVYTCKVSNLVGEVTSDPIIVTVVANPYSYNLFNLQLDMDRGE